MTSEDTPKNEEEVLPLPPATVSDLDRKILQYFPGLVVRKDLTKGLK